MSVRERILTIRLIEKLRAYPEYGRVLGVEVVDNQLKTVGKKEEK